MNKILAGEGKLSPAIFNLGAYVFIFLCPIFFLKGWDMNMIQGIFFTFGTFALFGLSLLCERQRNYNNKFIGIIVLMSLVNVFIHTFRFSLTNSYAANFINYCLLSEGFIFILCGAMLFWLIVSYSKNFNIAYPLIGINMLNLFFCITQICGLKLIWTNNQSIVSGMMGIAPHLGIFSAISVPILWYCKKPLAIIPMINIILGHLNFGYSFSGLFALSFAVVLWLTVKEKYEAAFILASVFAAYAFITPAFWGKFLLRVSLYAATIKEIIIHPLIGWGFDNTLTNNMILTKSGYMYRHNDYLNIAKDLGLPFLAMVTLYLKNLLSGAKKDYFWMAMITAMVCCFTWTSMYFARIAVVVIVLAAVIEVRKIERC